jgi:ribosome-associated protein
VNATFPAEVVAIVEAALDKKATDVTILDLRQSAAFADFFVICSGTNVRQVKAIVDSVDERLRAIDRRPSHIEGYERAEWVLVDCFDLLVHVFTPETRAFYGLERLWGTAVRTVVSDAADLKVTAQPTRKSRARQT